MVGRRKLLSETLVFCAHIPVSGDWLRDNELLIIGQWAKVQNRWVLPDSFNHTSHCCQQHIHSKNPFLKWEICRTYLWKGTLASPCEKPPPNWSPLLQLLAGGVDLRGPNSCRHSCVAALCLAGWPSSSCFSCKRLHLHRHDCTPAPPSCSPASCKQPSSCKLHPSSPASNLTPPHLQAASPAPPSLMLTCKLQASSPASNLVTPADAH